MSIIAPLTFPPPTAAAARDGRIARAASRATTASWLSARRQRQSVGPNRSVSQISSGVGARPVLRRGGRDAEPGASSRERRGIDGERERDLLRRAEPVAAGLLRDVARPLDLVELPARGPRPPARASALSLAICSAREAAAWASPTWRAKTTTIQTATRTADESGRRGDG